MKCAVIAVTLACIACARVPAMTPTPEVQWASSEVRSWGNLIHSWSIDRDGRVEFVRDERPFEAGNLLEVRRVTLTGAQRSALAAMLAKVDAILLKPEQCSESLTDAPYGELRWNMAGRNVSAKWSANCVKGRDADLTQAIGDTDKMVSDAALATPVLETRPPEGGGKEH